MLAALRREYRSLPPAYWTIWLGTLVNKTGGFVVPFMALYITRERHESEGVAGAVMSLYGAGSILAGFVLLNLGTATVMWQNGMALPIDMLRHGITASGYGALIAMNGVMIVFLQPLITRVIARRKRTLVMALSALLLGTGFGLHGVVVASAGYALAIAVWTLGEIANLPTASAVVADLAPPALRGRCQGVYGMSWGVASCVGPLLGGFFLGGPGGRALWFSCFGLMAVVACGQVALGRARERREQASRANAPVAVV